MEHYAGIDVSLEESSVCIVDATGTIVREVKIASEPEALVRYFDELELPVGRIGLEAGPLSQWLHAGLVAAGRAVTLMEAIHRAVMPHKPPFRCFVQIKFRHVFSSLAAQSINKLRPTFLAAAIPVSWPSLPLRSRLSSLS
jgi:hypothetical protein